MEHRINIEERVNLVPVELQIANPKVLENINKELHQLRPLSPKSYICRVHKELCKVNLEAYTPKLVSIGPYHLPDSNLSAMREHKLRYLRSLLNRGNTNSMKRYISKLEELEDRARKCYPDPIDQMSSDGFVEMMLLDGCFIIEFILKNRSRHIDNDDPIFNMSWMHCLILRDMLLLENQLPFFVLSKLYDITNEDLDQKMSFMDVVANFFFTTIYLLPMPCPNSLNNILEIKHLVHFVHALYHPPSESTSSKGNTRDNDEILEQMRSVVELQEAGVKFKKAGEVSLFDIKFDNGLMEIPCFDVEDSTETFFRNLIAYEQHSSDVECKYFTDYACFMDQLISSEKDVNLLRLNGIIGNLLGEDKKVSELFNKLGDGVINSTNFYYFEVCNKVNTHCEKRWNVVMATLRHKYFNNPWAGVSTVAAGVLLILTLLQTIAALLDLS